MLGQFKIGINVALMGLFFGEDQFSSDILLKEICLFEEWQEQSHSSDAGQ